MKLTIQLDQEVNGRWIAEIPELNMLLYGDSKLDAVDRVQAAAREMVRIALHPANCRPISRLQDSTRPHECSRFVLNPLLDKNPKFQRMSIRPNAPPPPNRPANAQTHPRQPPNDAVIRRHPPFPASLRYRCVRITRAQPRTFKLEI